MVDSAVWGVARPKFLLLPPLCVALGMAVAAVEGYAVEPVRVVMVLLGALAAHVAVNALNEVADFRSGLDLTTDRTPFSGGSGTLVARPDLLPAAARLGDLALAVTAGCGLWLVWQAGWGLLPIGCLGVLTVLAYAGPLLRYRWLVLLAPGFGFGSLMVVGAHYALSGELSLLAVAASLPVFFLINNLLLLNQFPDREADRAIGRDNLVIHDLRLAAAVYGLFVLATLAAIIGLSLSYPPVLVAALPLLLAVRCWSAARVFSGDVQALLPALGMNVLVSLATPALLALAFWAVFFFDL